MNTRALTFAAAAVIGIGALCHAAARATETGPTSIRSVVTSVDARELWRAETPLPKALFGAELCRLDASLEPTPTDYDWYRFFGLTAAGYKDMYAGFCLLRAGLDAEGREAFLEARRQLTDALQALVDTAEKQAAAQRELIERQERLRATQQALNTLAPALRPKDTQRAAQFDQNMRFMNSMTDVQLSSLAREVAAIRVLPAARLDQTIRLPIVPVGGFPRLLVKVTHDRGHCSGSFVGPRHVLTNLHCVGQKMQVTRDLIFYQETYPVVRWHTPAGVNFVPQGNDVRERFWDDDWAILEIGGRRSDENHYFFVSTAIADQAPIMIAGYSGDVSGGRYLTLDVGCSINGMTASKLRYQCSTAPGSSGSPVLLPTDHRVIVGLHHAGQRVEESVSAVTRTNRAAIRVDRFLPTLQRLVGPARPLPSADGEWDTRLASLRQERGTPLPTLGDFPALD